MFKCNLCKNEKILEQSTVIICKKCGQKYNKINNLIDFIEERNLNILEINSLQLWGQNLHDSKKQVPYHYISIKENFNSEWNESLKGKILDLGCGSGQDISYFNNLKNLKQIIGIDIGKNIYDLANKYKEVFFIRSSALNIPLKSDYLDTVYSYGVIHHTKDPKKAFNEMFRILKKNGNLFMYLYSEHENNIIKFYGIKLENFLRKFLNILKNKYLKIIFIYILSFICWLLFTLPSYLLKLIRLKKFSKNIPMNWGTHPFSLVNDLKDRLLAPYSKRYYLKEIRRILVGLNFEKVNIKYKSSGLYIHCKK